MESKQCRIENSSISKENKVLQTKMKVLRKNNVPCVNKNKELQIINETAKAMILQYIFSMATSTNLLATLLFLHFSPV